MPESNKQQLGELARSRRKYLGYHSVNALAESTKISNRLISDLETGRRTNFSSSTQEILERAYGWKRGSIQVALGGGGTPVVIADPFASEDGSPDIQNPRPSADLEDEFAAMEAIQSAIERLGAAARVRVLRWALDRCNAETVADSVGDGQSA